VLAAALTASACSTLPPRGVLPEVTAAAAPASSPLRAIAQASVPAGSPSGFRLLASGDQALDARLALIARARHRIDLQAYHWHDDATGQAMVQALHAAARRGVQVRLLVDDLHVAPALPLLRPLAEHAGVELRLFNPLPARRGTPLARIAFSAHEFERINRRMHNKLLLVDDAFAIYGGRNLGDEYFMRHAEANFIDIDVLSAGAVVHDLALAFERHWHGEPVWPLAVVEPRAPLLPVATGEGADAAAAPWQAAAPADATSAARRIDPQRIDELGQASVSAHLAAGRLPLRPGHAEVHADAPAKVTDPIVRYRPSAAMQGLLTHLASAQRELNVVSPYFIPGPVGLKLLAEARDKGVQTQVITNSLGATDEPLVHRAYARYRPQLLALGVDLYELSPALAQRLQRSGKAGEVGASASRLHAKLAVIDRARLLVGSVNLDPRSAVLNTELLVAIDSPALAGDVLRLLDDVDLRHLYRPQLGADGERLRWLTSDEQGRWQMTRAEPHDPWWSRQWHRLMGLFLDEINL